MQNIEFYIQKLGDYLITKIIALWKNACFHSNTQAVFGVSNNFKRYCMLERVVSNISLIGDCIYYI